LPFFYIVGFDNVGPVTQKFFWYWFFNFLLQGTMLFLGEFYVSLAPNEATTQSTFPHDACECSSSTENPC
jgi:hypothetical protein